MQSYQNAERRSCRQRRLCTPRRPHFVRGRISTVTARETLTNSFITYHANDSNFTNILRFFSFLPEKKLRFLTCKILFYVSVDVKRKLKSLIG